MTDTETPKRAIRVNAASGKIQVWDQHRHGWGLVPESKTNPVDNPEAPCEQIPLL